MDRFHKFLAPNFIISKLTSSLNATKIFYRSVDILGNRIEKKGENLSLRERRV